MQLGYVLFQIASPLDAAAGVDLFLRILLVATVANGRPLLQRDVVQHEKHWFAPLRSSGVIVEQSVLVLRLFSQTVLLMQFFVIR